MSEPFIGQIQAFGFNFAPRGWAFCDGQILPISQSQALFSLIGTFYGGDGRTTMGLPDLRGRTPIHMGRGPGLSDRRIGTKYGFEYVTLATTEMPSHKHDVTISQMTATLNAINDDGENKTPGGHTIANSAQEFYSDAAPNTPMHAGSVTLNGTGAISDTGGSQPHQNMQPFLVVNYCIALMGVYPSRS